MPLALAAQLPPCVATVLQQGKVSRGSVALPFDFGEMASALEIGIEFLEKWIQYSKRSASKQKSSSNPVLGSKKQYSRSMSKILL